MENGTLIAIKGNLYEYGHYDEDSKRHIAYFVEIDEDGGLTATYDAYDFTDEELLDDKINLTQAQWGGLVYQHLANNYELTTEEMDDIIHDVSRRCFAVTGAPKVHELPEYIAEYMNR